MQMNCNLYIKHMSWIQETLATHGANNSRVREQIIIAIEGICKMFDAQMLQKTLPKINKVTIYRTLERLALYDIIHPTMQYDGRQYYELHSPEGHHHHAFCTVCHAQECMECNLPQEEKKHHTMYYTFVCDTCH